MLNAGNWTIQPNTVPTAINLSLTLKERGHTNSVAPSTRYGIIRRDDAGSAWLGAPMGTHSNATQSEVGGTATATRTGITTANFWGDFGIGFGSAPLPVEWLSFVAYLKSNTVVLDWKTASESGNDYFMVERSIDGHNFEAIGTVAGNGNTNTISSYSFTDYNPGTGILYYRLRQVDFDGQLDYSKIVPVRIGTGVSPVVLYPNPIRDIAFVLINTEIIGDVLLEIFDAAGKLVQSENANVLSGSNTIQIDVSSLPQGFYFLKQGVEVVKLVVSR